MKTKKILIILAVVFLYCNTYAQNDGAANTGLAFLKIGVGARAIAMGDAFSSVVDDATAVIYNPARLTIGNANNVSLMHNTGMMDMNTNFIGAKTRIGKLGIGFGLLQTSVDGIEVRNIPGAPIDNFDAKNLSLGLSAGLEIYKNITVGLTVKMLYEKIFIDEAAGTGVDIGTSYSKDNLNFSFVIANLGSVNELRNVATKLPTLVRFGGSYKYIRNDIGIIFGVESFKVLDGGLLHIHSGAEFGYKDFIFIRAGYQTNYENKGLTTGAGVKYKGISLDYAFVPYSLTFGNSSTFSLGFSF